MGGAVALGKSAIQLRAKKRATTARTWWCKSIPSGIAVSI
jgi:hypothetical protein